MNWRQSVFVSTVVAIGFGLVGCGEDLPIASSEPEPVVLDIPYDEDLAEQGATLYASQCERCHKDRGLALSGNVTPILQVAYGTESAIAEDRLANRTARTMPEGSADSCDLACGLKIQEFFYKTWTDDYLNPPVEEPAVSAEESEQRVAAGEELYTGQGNACVLCHGEDGKGGLSVAIDTTDRNYSSLVEVIRTGIASEGMPACMPQPATCAPTIADFIWVEFLGGTLTASGGIR